MKKNKVAGVRTDADWFALFTEVNDTCEPDEVTPLTMENAKYYSEQIWNLTNEGDLPETECDRIAKEICSGAYSCFTR